MTRRHFQQNKNKNTVICKFINACTDVYIMSLRVNSAEKTLLVEFLKRCVCSSDKFLISVTQKWNDFPLFDVCLSVLQRVFA